MQPLTAHRAKPTLPVLGRSLVGRIMAHLHARGVSDFSVNAWHQPDGLAETLRKDSPPETETQLFVESELMGSAGAFLAPRSRLARTPLFIYQNGDTLIDAPLAALAQAAGGERCLGALLVREGVTPGYGGLILRGGTVVRRFLPGEAPAGGDPATFLGVGVFRRELLPEVIPGRPSELFPDLLLPLLDRGWSLAAVPSATPWLEFTSPAQYLDRLTGLVRAGAASGKVRLPGGDAFLAQGIPGGAFLGDNAHLAPGSRLGGGVVMERETRAEPGSSLYDVLLLEGARTGSGVCLERVVVDQGVQLPPNSEFRHGVVTLGPNGKLEFIPFPGRGRDE